MSDHLSPPLTIPDTNAETRDPHDEFSSHLDRSDLLIESQKYLFIREFVSYATQAIAKNS